MTGRRIRAVVAVVVAGAFLGTTQLPALARVVDSILLSKLVWGMPSDRLAKTLKLDPAKYTILHDPTNIRITILKISGTPFNFPEFRTVYLNFDPQDGLFKVNGFYEGELADIVASLSNRYGKPDMVKTTSLAKYYRWDFDDTVLSIFNAQFEIFPRYN